MIAALAFILLSLTQAGPNQATNASAGSRDDRDAQLQFMVRALDESYVSFHPQARSSK